MKRLLLGKLVLTLISFMPAGYLFAMQSKKTIQKVANALETIALDEVSEGVKQFLVEHITRIEGHVQFIENWFDEFIGPKYQKNNLSYIKNVEVLKAKIHEINETIIKPLTIYKTYKEIDKKAFERISSITTDLYAILSKIVAMLESNKTITNTMKLKDALLAMKAQVDSDLCKLDGALNQTINKNKNDTITKKVISLKAKLQEFLKTKANSLTILSAIAHRLKCR